MPSPSYSWSQQLHDTNQRLLHWLDSSCGELGQPRLATPDHITALLSEMLRAGTQLRAHAIPEKGTDPELEAELEQYRVNVERLRAGAAIHPQPASDRTRAAGGATVAHAICRGVGAGVAPDAVGQAFLISDIETDWCLRSARWLPELPAERFAQRSSW